MNTRKERESETEKTRATASGSVGEERERAKKETIDTVGCEKKTDKQTSKQKAV